MYPNTVRKVQLNYVGRISMLINALGNMLQPLYMEIDHPAQHNYR